MRRLRWIGLAVALALAATGIAVAAHEAGTADTDAVAASSFSASRSIVSERICKGADGDYRQAHELFEGTASGEARLTGKITLRLHSLVNQTTGLGTAKGKVWIRDATTGQLKAKANLLGVITEKGTLNGVLLGRVPGDGRLVANFKVTWSSATALSGQLGTGAGENTAVIQVGSCPGHKEEKAQRGEGRERGTRLEVRKELSPEHDPGRVNLLIDSTTHAAAVGDEGKTGKREVAPGIHTVAEAAAATDTNLANYNTSVSCRDKHGKGAVIATGGDPPSVDRKSVV